MSGPLGYAESMLHDSARCQLLECLAEEKKAPSHAAVSQPCLELCTVDDAQVYILDEITTDSCSTD